MVWTTLERPIFVILELRQLFEKDISEADAAERTYIE
jgi:hypothetical protein